MSIFHLLSCLANEQPEAVSQPLPAEDVSQPPELEADSQLLPVELTESHPSTDAPLSDSDIEKALVNMVILTDDYDSGSLYDYKKASQYISDLGASLSQGSSLYILQV